MAADDNTMFIICDKDLKVMSIDGIPIFGVKCTIPAIFFSEDQALEVLFNVEDAGVLKEKHTVRKLDRLTGTL